METENENEEAASATNGAATPAPAPAPKKPRKTRNMGTLAMAFAATSTLDDGQEVDVYIVPRGQPDFESTKAVKDFVGVCAENGDFDAEFAEHSVAIVRLVGDPMTVTKEVKTTVSFG